MSEQGNSPPVRPSASDADAAAEHEGDAELGDLSRAYRDALKEHPPAAIDDAIRAAARRAVRSRPRALRKSAIERWTGPVAAAAVVVLSVSVSLFSVDEKPEMLPPPVRQVLQPRLTEPAEAPAAAREETSAASAKPEQDAGTSQGEGERSPPAPAGTMHGGPEKNLEKKKTTSVPITTGTPATASKPARFAADPLRASGIKTEAPPNADAIDQDASSNRATVQAAPARADAMDQGTRDRAAAPAAPPTNKSSETAKPLLRPPAPADAPAGAGTQRVIPQAEVRSLSRSPAVSPAPAATGDAAGDPEAWLRQIVELRRQGKTQEAEEELLRFKGHYPDYALPMELREIAR